VAVSWDKIFKQGQLWRLFVAHFFSFDKVALYINCIAFINVGRYLESKIRWPAFILMMEVAGILTNILYICFNSFCSGIGGAESTSGFNMVLFFARVIHTFTLYDEGRGPEDEILEMRLAEPNFLFGIFPIPKRFGINPWLPIVEMVVFNVIILDRCIAQEVAAILVAVPFPLIVHHLVMNGKVDLLFTQEGVTSLLCQADPLPPPKKIVIKTFVSESTDTDGIPRRRRRRIRTISTSTTVDNEGNVTQWFATPFVPNGLVDVEIHPEGDGDDDEEEDYYEQEASGSG